MAGGRFGAATMAGDALAMTNMSVPCLKKLFESPPARVSIRGGRRGIFGFPILLAEVWRLGVSSCGEVWRLGPGGCDEVWRLGMSGFAFGEVWRIGESGCAGVEAWRLGGGGCATSAVNSCDIVPVLQEPQLVVSVVLGRCSF